MPGSNDVAPYRGFARKDHASGVKWVLSATSWRGARPHFNLDMEKVFSEDVLREWLFLEGFNAPRIELTSRECIVFFPSGASLPSRPTARLVTILRRHYGHYKGRPINWQAG